MDTLITEEQYLSGPQYQILGDENAGSQTLQFVLLPQQQVIVHNKSILYTSENVVDHTKEAAKEWQSGSLLPGGQNGANFLMFIYNVSAWILNQAVGAIARLINEVFGGGNVDPPMRDPGAAVASDNIGYRQSSPLSSQCNTVLANNSGTIGYAALQHSKGRIIVIDNELNDGMIINRKYVLAHTQNIVLRRATQNSAGALGGFEQFLAEGILGMAPLDPAGDRDQNDNGLGGGRMNQGNNAMQNIHQNTMNLVLMELGMHDHLQVQRVTKTKISTDSTRSRSNGSGRANRRNRAQNDGATTDNDGDGGDDARSRSQSGSESERPKGGSNMAVADQIKHGLLETRELLFFQSQANIIEKTLGEGETIQIRPECLVAFSNSVLLKKQVAHDFMWLGGLIQFNGLSQKIKFIKVKGPGLLYIDMKQSKTFFKRDQLSMYVIMLYALLYFSMFLVILLDRRDPPQIQQLGAEGVAPAQNQHQAQQQAVVNPWIDQ